MNTQSCRTMNKGVVKPRYRVFDFFHKIYNIHMCRNLRQHTSWPLKGLRRSRACVLIVILYIPCGFDHQKRQIRPSVWKTESMKCRYTYICRRWRCRENRDDGSIRSFYSPSFHDQDRRNSLLEGLPQGSACKRWNRASISTLIKWNALAHCGKVGSVSSSNVDWLPVVLHFPNFIHVWTRHQTNVTSIAI